jgi:uncharacterized protein (TIGR02996 family)
VAVFGFGRVLLLLVGMGNSKFGFECVLRLPFFFPLPALAPRKGSNRATGDRFLGAVPKQPGWHFVTAEAMMSHQAFLQAIMETPDDDTPRLIYADWLEDNGDKERAEFIQLQCQIAELSPDDDPFTRAPRRPAAKRVP